MEGCLNRVSAAIIWFVLCHRDRLEVTMSDGCVLEFWEMGLSLNAVTALNNQHVGFLRVMVVSKTIYVLIERVI